MRLSLLMVCSAPSQSASYRSRFDVRRRRQQGQLTSVYTASPPTLTQDEWRWAASMSRCLLDVNMWCVTWIAYVYDPFSCRNLPRSTFTFAAMMPAADTLMLHRYFSDS